MKTCARELMCLRGFTQPLARVGVVVAFEMYVY